MSFDKSKATLNAERYLAQGKISAAISEYKQIVANDPRDFSTLNMLGDLHAKNSDKTQAVQCYSVVADHYRKQGFAQKAIAVYKKIAKIRPESTEIAEKLAELYKAKGSVLEAKSHYTTLAEHYQSKGRKTEALAIWKQIILLDPNNCDVCLSLGHSYMEESQADDAAEAFCEAGSRLVRQERHDEAVEAYKKALQAKPDSSAALNGLVRTKSALGKAEEAVVLLEEMAAAQPYNRELLTLLVESYVTSGNAAEAEKYAVKLVEQEPGSYAKFLDLVKLNLEQENLQAASRNLALCSENLLVGGRAEEFHEWIDSILAKDADQMGALRLQARYFSWQRNDEALRGALEKLAEVARQSESVDDERYALSQLVMIASQEAEFAERLRELNEKHNFDENPFDETILKEQFLRDAEEADLGPAGFEFTGAAIVGDHVAEPALNGSYEQEPAAANGFRANGKNGAGKIAADELGELEQFTPELESTDKAFAMPGQAPTQQNRDIDAELESIRFYISNEYLELAEKSLDELAALHGELQEITEIRSQLAQAAAAAAQEPAHAPAEPETEEITVETIVETDIAFAEPLSEPEPQKGNMLDLSDLRSEFGLEEPEAANDDDYETHYQMAVAYQEMGLIEESIKEYQDAIAQVSPHDGTRRFFHCSILLGHCFMQQGMAKLALKWLNRAAEIGNLSDDEKQGLWYEIADAYEADGDVENAARYFEQVYSENVDFRDVGDRVKNLLAAH